jgi:hypothetical protein
MFSPLLRMRFLAFYSRRNDFIIDALYLQVLLIQNQKKSIYVILNLHYHLKEASFRGGATRWNRSSTSFANRNRRHVRRFRKDFVRNPFLAEFPGRSLG